MLDELLHEHMSGRSDHSATLWSLLMLDTFLRHTQQPVVPVSGKAAHTVRPADVLPEAMP